MPALHFHDSYAGIPMTKFPEDLRIYEHLMWESRPDVVVEIGVQHGASSLWFRDRLRALEHYGRVRSPRVVGLDIDIAAAEHNLERTDPSWRESITLLQGDIRERTTIERVLAAVPQGATCLLIEDSAHEKDTTLAACAAWRSSSGPAASSSSRTAAWTSTACAWTPAGRAACCPPSRSGSPARTAPTSCSAASSSSTG